MSSAETRLAVRNRPPHTREFVSAKIAARRDFGGCPAKTFRVPCFITICTCSNETHHTMRASFMYYSRLSLGWGMFFLCEKSGFCCSIYSSYIPTFSWLVFWYPAAVRNRLWLGHCERSFLRMATFIPAPSAYPLQRHSRHSLWKNLCNKHQCF